MATGPTPSKHSTWIFTIGKARKPLLKMLGRATAKGHVQWFVFVTPPWKEAPDVDAAARHHN